MKYVLFCMLLYSCIGCSKLLYPVDVKADPISVFDYTAQKVQENYSFFELKGINWDSITKQYRRKVTASTTDPELYEVLNNLLGELKDGHVNLYTKMNKGRYWDWFNNYANNFNRNFVELTYLKKNYKITGPFVHNWIDSVGYIYYGSFSSGFSNEELGYTLMQYKAAKGIILDVRDNGGGSTTNILNLMGRFVKNRTWVGCHHLKCGPTANDFELSKDVYVNPVGFLQITDKPVMVLTNRRCYSATSFFAAFMATLPNVTLVGDQTGGGSGVPISMELPNGWSVRYSASHTENAKGVDFELGVPPDVWVTTGATEELAGKDAIIEKAKSLILEKHASK